MSLTFRGGTHLHEHKNTAHKQIEVMEAPRFVRLPMSQHIGAHCTPVVNVGDAVDLGQPIGVVEHGLGCPIHASVSGTVREIISVKNSDGNPLKTVVIENDREYRVWPQIKPVGRPYTELTTDEIIEMVRAAGISGMGGATFPTYAKIQSALGKVKTLIVNCAECEPYITADHRHLVERPGDIIGGMEILLHALNLSAGIIAIEDNKRDAVEIIKRFPHDEAKVRVEVLKTKYPQGDERQIIYALTGVELPAGKLPADVGCVIFNANTCAAVFRAYVSGMPVTRRVVTVAGDCVREPKNVLVPLGVSYGDLLDFCGGLKKPPKKIIAGGPMMGPAQWNLEFPVLKGTSALLALSRENQRSYEQPSACIRCGKCVANCPMHLMPIYLFQFNEQGDMNSAERYNVTSCVECGCCSYNCPGNVQLVQHIRVAKTKVLADQRAKKLNETKKEGSAK